jgi:TatD DNase family protein
MMGLHPCSVKDDYKRELEIVEEWINKRNFVAIGEIGLDFYWDKTFVKEQKNTFNMQMQWALEKKWPIVIHSRNSIDECIEMVKPFSQKGLLGIFHCFSGTADQAKQIIDLNFYLGIGGVLTYKNSGLKESIQEIDLKHMVLETDAPYLAPVPYRGKRNESSFIKIIAESLALVKNTSLEEVAAITTANAEKIFGA